MGAQEPNCAEVGTGLYEYPENCRKYYSCDVTGTLSLELCYDNWLFSAPKQYCDFPENVECAPDLVNVELEPCSSEYCTCTNGIGYLVECEEGLTFNQDINQGQGGCDWPYNNCEDCDDPQCPA